MLKIYSLTSDKAYRNIDNIMIRAIAKAIYDSKEFQDILMPTIKKDKKENTEDN